MVGVKKEGRREEKRRGVEGGREGGKLSVAIVNKALSDSKRHTCMSYPIPSS